MMILPWCKLSNCTGVSVSYCLWSADNYPYRNLPKT